jgi:hypothetical protein
MIKVTDDTRNIEQFRGLPIRLAVGTRTATKEINNVARSGGRGIEYRSEPRSWGICHGTDCGCERSNTPCK